MPARVGDNRFNNPEYTKLLQNLTGWQKQAWFDGDWDIAPGQFFTAFRREVHVIDEFDDTRAVEWFAALDYGFTHYTVALLGCADEDGVGGDDPADALRYLVATKARSVVQRNSQVFNLTA